VAERVAHGGHSIPPEAITRRFPRSLNNLLHVYAGAADETRCFVNSAAEPDIVFVQTGGERTIWNSEVYAQLVNEAGR
jgi:predicted ABC-type ATPase